MILSVSSIITSILDIEIHYLAHGKLISETRPPVFDIPCKYQWNISVYDIHQNSTSFIKSDENEKPNIFKTIGDITKCKYQW